ncbi:MAG: HNH endonuclease signature motif containing protein, partial [Acidimicrobiales bacterium]
IVDHARTLPYPDFDDFLTQWTKLVDEDGTCHHNQRRHHQRNVSLHQDFDDSWTLKGSFAALQGAEIDTILRHYLDLEFAIDWDQATAEHGDATTTAHLARTEHQRRADAFHKMCLAANVSGSGKPAVVTGIVIDQATFARWIRKLNGTDPGPDDPWRPGYRCNTTDGIRLEPGEAVAAALLGDIRRIITDAKGVVIDLGRRSRLFTGGARIAAQIPHTHCIWPGCHVPTSRCHIDHATPWAPIPGVDPGGGTTSSDNAAPLCAKQTGNKQHGYRTKRGPDGNWTVTRPDGTTLQEAGPPTEPTGSRAADAPR